VYLMRFRTSTGGKIATVYLSSTNKVGYRNDVASTTSTSSTTAATNTWHDLQAHVLNGTAGLIEVWLDGTKIINAAQSLGTNAIQQVQLGDDASSRTYDVAFDEVAADPNFIGGDTTPPTAPTNLVASAPGG